MLVRERVLKLREVQFHGLRRTGLAALGTWPSLCLCVLTCHLGVHICRCAEKFFWMPS